MPAMDLFTYHHMNQPKSAPMLKFDYLEKDTGNYWHIWVAVDRIYLYRMGQQLGSRDDEMRNMEADLMVRRLECALLLAKKGIFQFKCTSAWRFSDVEFKDTSTVTCSLRSAEAGHDTDVIIDWFNAFSRLTLIRRAADDAYMASVMGPEAIFFIYRGFEWLKKALKVSWDDLGSKIDVPQANIKWLKKAANNHDWPAARHAVESGHKGHLDEEILPTWVYGLVHGIIHARCRLDPKFAAQIEQQGDPWPLEEQKENALSSQAFAPSKNPSPSPLKERGTQGVR